MTNPLPIILNACGALGLFAHVDEVDAGNLRDWLTEDGIVFSIDPSEAERLAQPGKVIFVFGRRHPRVVADALELCGLEVEIDPDVVLTEDLYHPPVSQLLSLGQIRGGEKRDYAALGLSRNDVPALIRMATDYQLHDGPQGSPVVWSSIHAWRALTQLRAEEAIGPLVELFHRAEDMDEWVSNELPKALAQFGAAAITPLTEYLRTATHGDWSRVVAAKTIGLVGEANPECRADCIARLSGQLDRCAEQSDTLNAFLISPLLDLRAVEAMPAIERAFASGRVDESVLGDVEDVQIEFGLKTQREHAPKPNKLTIMGEKFRAQWQAAGLPLPDATGHFPKPEADLPSFGTPYIAPPKIGRNDPCPCGSKKKFKKCCGA